MRAQTTASLRAERSESQSRTFVCEIRLASEDDPAHPHLLRIVHAYGYDQPMVLGADDTVRIGPYCITPIRLSAKDETGPAIAPAHFHGRGEDGRERPIQGSHATDPTSPTPRGRVRAGAA